LEDKSFENVLIKDLLAYEQPTTYLVADTDYSDDKNLTPVLTANKSFILGYTHEERGIYQKGECIIFDDFTMDLKYVEFPFKVKSSAIKILTKKPGVNLKFVFEFLSFLNLSTTEHKRHYISEIEPIHLTVPTIKVQYDIAEVLSKFDKKIDIELKLRQLFLKQKISLLSNMFI
jgi:type I restriction enzyme S subunit